MVVFLEDVLVPYLCWLRSSLFWPDNLLSSWPELEVLRNDMVCVSEVVDKVTGETSLKKKFSANKMS